MELIAELWRRAQATYPAPDGSTLAVLGLVALGLVVLAWVPVRMLVTVCHEAGHAVTATLTGRALKGIRLHSDTSGLTLTKGRPGGAGMIATLFAGYPAASLVGLAAAAMAGAGYSAGLLWLLLILLALMLLSIRNVYGAIVVLLLGAGVAAITWYATPVVLTWLTHGMAWLLLIAGPRPVVESLTSRTQRRSSTSDAAQLTRLTGVPKVMWSTVWLGLTLGALGLGIVWMVPGVLRGLPG